MDTSTAKSIPILNVCQALGLTREKESGGNTYFKSPRVPDQRTGSLSVSPSKGLWNDYATGEAGDAIRLVEYVRAVGFHEAMEWIERQFSSFSQKSSTQARSNGRSSHDVAATQGIQVIEAKPLYSYPLKKYLEGRCIPVDVAATYVREVRYRNAGKEFYAIGFPNDAGGYELRSGTFKGASAPKEVSFIHGSRQPSEALTIFEGFIDFLSALVYFKLARPNFDTVVLNSAAMVNHVLPLLGKYQAIQCYLDHDQAGQTILQKIQAAHSRVVDRSTIYQSSKDFNDLLVCQKSGSNA